MIDGMVWAMLGAVAAVAVQWGSLQVQVRWLRADVERAHVRLDTHDKLMRRITDR